MTNILQATLADSQVVVQWADGTQTRYPGLWLRDNDASAFHPHTRERIFDLLSVDSTIMPDDLKVIENGETLALRWPDLAEDSQYSATWLASHKPNERYFDAAHEPVELWNANTGTAISRHTASLILEDEQAMLAFLKDTMARGLTIVEGLADKEDSGLEIGRRIGPMRNSNFGTVFDVISKPDPNNLAYTSGDLPLHTDLPNQETPPGYQFLHCIVNNADGGESLYCDGFQIADYLRREDSAAFDLLARTPVPFRFHDENTDIRNHRPIITVDENDEVTQIAWNAHLAEAFDMAPDVISAYYDAWRTFMGMVRDPAYVITVKLNAGEMVVFDNRRVLHGRAEFFPNTGNRHLKGYYIDRVDLESRIRLLSA